MRGIGGKFIEPGRGWIGIERGIKTAGSLEFGMEGTKEMYGKGKEKFMWEIEKFVVTRLRPFRKFPYYHTDELSVEERLEYMNKWWEGREKNRYRNKRGELVGFPQLTNHEICHEMFWNAFRGGSEMYIQIKDLRSNQESRSDRSNEIPEGREVITLQCSLLTTQMLDYDVMMFRAMSDLEDEEYSEAAKRFYRPYLFSYVTEVDRENYKRLKELQEEVGNRAEGQSPYLWLECTFRPDIDSPNIALDGYVVQSASSINKIKAELYITENGTSTKRIKEILDRYKVRKSCVKDDKAFEKAIEGKLGNNRLSTIDVYKIGNGNCVYAQGLNSKMGFFYDIGFNYRHRPKKIAPGVNYSYSDTMKKIYAKRPSFFILSHWDMDHIAGSAAARKDFLDKDWFAPDCHDACIDAQRLAKYLDIKDHLILADRRSWKGKGPGRLIGEISIRDASVPPQTVATYRLYMGKKASCDSSSANCEGIVVEYTDEINNKTVLMMGDVNYASFDKARSEANQLLFADTKIDYLIAPHHGSDHTDHDKIINGNSIPIQGTMAVICCTNKEDENRPSKEHREELKKRFNDNVRTTEEALPGDDSIRILL